MNKSDNINELASAMASAQSMMAPAKKTQSNPFFKSKYADISAVWEAAQSALNSNGVSVIQGGTIDADGQHYIETMLTHSSGQWISSFEQILCKKKDDPQAHGAAVTYARRYGLLSMLSLPCEDDDGESAMNREAPPEPARANEPERTPAQKLVQAFNLLSVTRKEIEEFTSKSVEDLKGNELVQLRDVYMRVKNGEPFPKKKPAFKPAAEVDYTAKLKTQLEVTSVSDERILTYCKANAQAKDTEVSVWNLPKAVHKLLSLGYNRILVELEGDEE